MLIIYLADLESDDVGINEKQKVLNEAFMKMSEEAQEVVLKFVQDFAEKHPKERHLKLVVVKPKSN